MSKIKCIIVDDEKLAREGVALLLSRTPEFEVLDLCANGKQAVESILHYEPNLVFLDIQMPDMDGFEVLKSLPADKIPIIIFITAYDKYAIKAFEASAFDYLLKPFDPEELGIIIEKIIAPLGRRIDESTPMVDARLPDGSRVNAIIPPLAIANSTMSSALADSAGASASSGGSSASSRSQLMLASDGMICAISANTSRGWP